MVATCLWTIKATLWRTICPFTKCELLLIVFFSYNTTGQFHGWMHNTTGQFHVWMDTMSVCHNTMGKYHGLMNTMGGCHLQFHGWMNNMGGWIPWVDTISYSDHSSLLKKQWSPLHEVPAYEAFVEYEEPLKRRVLCGLPITMMNEDLRIEIPCNACDQLWYW